MEAAAYSSQSRLPQQQTMQMQMQNPIEADSNSNSSVTTLLVRNLAEAIPHDMLSRLFSHYGASALRPSSTSRLRNCAFVDFKNEALAYQAHRQLNGLRFLGKVLKVEKAKSVEDNKVKQGEGQLRVDSIASRSLMTDAMLIQNLSGQKPENVPTGEPIAPRLGVEYPFPPHLEYAYPPPDGNILTNIVNALIAVPRFYTQVLHLMNKMNLPAPFRMALPTPPLPPSVPAEAPLQPSPPAAPSDIKPQLADTSSDESEMDYSDEGLDDRNSAGDLGFHKPGHKRVKRENIVGPAVDKDVAHEAVGVKPSTLTPKEIPKIKTNAPVLKIKITPRIAQSETKDDKIEDLKDSNNEEQDIKSYLSAEEIESERLPPEEILSLPTFKNYTAGNPAPVLYIKNLAKDVVADDIYFVFGSLFGSVDEAKSGLNVRLMQEGRMRGQAFVTFPSVQLAQHALSLVHGYVLKGKPMIIQFGRNPGTAKTN